MEQGKDTRKDGFRVVIVGGGLVGLVAAHIFSKIDVDFVVLERSESTANSTGSLLLLWPPAFRVLDQLGLLEFIEPVLEKVDCLVSVSAQNASIIKKNYLPKIVEDCHGYGIRVAHRPLFLNALYDSLPDSAKARVLLEKRVASVHTTEHGAQVICQDGHIEEGSMVIGADGCYSQVRECMQHMRPNEQAATVSEEQGSPYTTTYRMFFGCSPMLPRVPRQTMWETAGDGVSTQFLASSTKSWFALYEKLEHPTKKRVRYDEDDQQAVLEKWGHLWYVKLYP